MPPSKTRDFRQGARAPRGTVGAADGGVRHHGAQPHGPAFIGVPLQPPPLRQLLRFHDIRRLLQMVRAPKPRHHDEHDPRPLGRARGGAVPGKQADRRGFAKARGLCICRCRRTLARVHLPISRRLRRRRPPRRIPKRPALDARRGKAPPPRGEANARTSRPLRPLRQEGLRLCKRPLPPTLREIQTAAPRAAARASRGGTHAVQGPKDAAPPAPVTPAPRGA
mmetsp:Transcript_21721/g.73623  ORF Transcript_21721/g.73623 Transcript_21721/m.73623 type:complete len:223 (-) Transcript_21721:164-832(-)